MARPAVIAATLAALAVAALLAGCASGPRGGGSGNRSIAARPGRDGAEAHPPTNLAQVPDAEPRAETIRSGGANKPYVVLGRGYTPLDPNAEYRETGLASWYGSKFNGASTSSGEPYDMYAMTAAHTTLPIPSYVRVRNPANGREVIVRINDRGPFHDGRVIDLSYAAAFKLDLLRGVAPVEVERITPVQIASGQWRRGNTGGGTVFAQASAPVVAAVPAAAVAAVAYPPPRPAPAPVRELTIYTPPPPAPAAQVPNPDTDPLSGFTAIALPTEARSADQDDAEPPPRSIIVTTLPSLSSAAQGTEAPAPLLSSPLAAGGSTGFWVQLGAFSRPEGASALARRAGGSATILQDGSLNRVQTGPFATREAAREAAQRLGEALQLAPVVVERH